MHVEQIETTLAPEAAPNMYAILEYIARNTDSVLLLAIIVIVVAIIVIVPLYLKSQKEIRKSENSDKRILIDVVQENTKAITDLRSTLEYNNLAMESSLKSIRDDTNQTNRSIIAIEHTIANLSQESCVITSNIASMMTNQATHMKALDLVRETTSELKDTTDDIFNTISKPEVLELPAKVDDVRDVVTTLCDAQSVNCGKMDEIDTKLSKALKKTTTKKASTSTAEKETK